jgi:lipoprotein-anchoring transpeptidase ErfK/SrfK
MSPLLSGDYARITRTPCLRMLSGPGWQYPVKVDIRKGAIVKVLSGHREDRWYRVCYRGWVGYQIARWLAPTSLAGAALARYYDKVIIVSLASQQLEAYQRGRVILITAVTTGSPVHPTPVGTTRITAKYSPFLMTSPWRPGTRYHFPETLMRYVLQFRANDYYLHHSPRRPYFGFGTNLWHLDPDGVVRWGSHGCVNMPLWSVTRLHKWAEVGTPVEVVRW